MDRAAGGILLPGDGRFELREPVLRGSMLELTQARDLMAQCVVKYLEEKKPNEPDAR